MQSPKNSLTTNTNENAFGQKDDGLAVRNNSQGQPKKSGSQGFNESDNGDVAIRAKRKKRTSSIG